MCKVICFFCSFVCKFIKRVSFVRSYMSSLYKGADLVPEGEEVIGVWHVTCRLYSFIKQLKDILAISHEDDRDCGAVVAELLDKFKGLTCCNNFRTYICTIPINSTLSYYGGLNLGIGSKNCYCVGTMSEF